MLYRTLLIAAALTLPALATADDAAADKAAEADIKVNCIIDFIASEQDESTHDAFINECVAKQTAARKAQTGNKG